MKEIGKAKSNIEAAVTIVILDFAFNKSSLFQQLRYVTFR